MIYEQVFISLDDWTVHMNTCSYIGVTKCPPTWGGCKVKSLYSFDGNDDFAVGVLVDGRELCQRDDDAGQGVLAID